MILLFRCVNCGCLFVEKTRKALSRISSNSFISKRFISISSLRRRNFYKVLGVEKNASQKDIKDAYFKLSKELHPDKQQQGSADSHEQFVELNEAYQTLSKPATRSQYDLTLEGRRTAYEYNQYQQQYQRRYQHPSGFSGFGSSYGRPRSTFYRHGQTEREDPFKFTGRRTNESGPFGYEYDNKREKDRWQREYGSQDEYIRYWQQEYEERTRRNNEWRQRHSWPFERWLTFKHLGFLVVFVYIVSFFGPLYRMRRRQAEYWKNQREEYEKMMRNMTPEQAERLKRGKIREYNLSMQYDYERQRELQMHVNRIRREREEAREAARGARVNAVLKPAVDNLEKKEDWLSKTQPFKPAGYN